MGDLDAGMKSDNLDIDFLLHEKLKQHEDGVEQPDVLEQATEGINDEGMILGAEPSFDPDAEEKPTSDTIADETFVPGEDDDDSAGFDFDINDETVNLADALDHALGSPQELETDADDAQSAESGPAPLLLDIDAETEELQDLALLERQASNADLDGLPADQSADLESDKEKVGSEIESLMAALESEPGEPDAVNASAEDEESLAPATEPDLDFKLTEDENSPSDSTLNGNAEIELSEPGPEPLAFSSEERPDQDGGGAPDLASLLAGAPEVEPAEGDLLAPGSEAAAEPSEPAFSLDLALPVEPPSAPAGASHKPPAGRQPVKPHGQKAAEPASPFASFLKENQGKRRQAQKRTRQKADSASAAKKPKRTGLKVQVSLTSVFENSKLLGLDVGSDSVRYVQIKKSAAGYKLINCGNFAVPEIALDAPREVVSQKIGDAIRKNFNPRAFKNTLITTAVAGMEVLFKNVRVPKMSRKELAKAVPWACRKDFPFPIEKTIFQFQPTSDKKSAAENKLDMFVVAAQKEVLSGHLETLGRARITPSKISTIPVALWSVFRACAKRATEGCYAVIDIGDASSHIVFSHDGRLQFAREISTAGGDFTRALTGDMFIDGREVKLSFEQADKLKRKYGIPHENDDSVTEDGIPVKEIGVMMGPAAERLVNDIQRTLEFYKEKFKVDVINKIYLTGGGALMPNLSTLLVRELGLKVGILNPFETISLRKFSDQPRLAASGPRFATAVGLALDPGKELNLLPSEFKGSRTIQYVKRMFRYVFVILILTMAFLSQDVSREFRKLDVEFQRVNKEFRQGEPKRQKFLALQQALQALAKAGKEYGTSVNADLSAATHLKVISNYFPRNMTLTSLRIIERQRKVEGTENEFYNQEVMVLDGVAFQNNSMEGMNLAEFLIDLDKLNYFSSISLKSQKVREDGSLQFTLECEI